MAREKVQTEFTQEEVEAAFDRLEAALVKYGPLPCEDGSKRVARAGEFMLMQADKAKWLFFKHRVTRNYLLVNPQGVLKVPNEGTPFRRATYDGYPEAVVEVAS